MFVITNIFVTISRSIDIDPAWEKSPTRMLHEWGISCLSFSSHTSYHTFHFPSLFCQSCLYRATWTLFLYSVTCKWYNFHHFDPLQPYPGNTRSLKDVVKISSLSSFKSYIVGFPTQPHFSMSGSCYLLQTDPHLCRKGVSIVLMISAGGIKAPSSLPHEYDPFSMNPLKWKMQKLINTGGKAWGKCSWEKTKWADRVSGPMWLFTLSYFGDFWCFFLSFSFAVIRSWDGNRVDHSESHDRDFINSGMGA